MELLEAIDHHQAEVRSHHLYHNLLFVSLIGLIGKIERATHIDINRDGYIGGRPGYYPPQGHQKKH